MPTFAPPVSPMASRRSALALMLLPAVLALGCSKGPTLQRVRGKLVVDGQPAAGASLLFFTPGQKGGTMPSATVGPDGGFEIITNGKPGVMTGSYNVTAIWPDPAKAEEAMKDLSGKADPPDLLGGKFSIPDTSPLKAEIGSGTKELPPFEISTK